MKHLATILCLFTFSHLHYFTLSAAVPLRWTVETSRVQPATFDAYQGETLSFEAALQSYGKPLAAPAEYAIYWQTNGMGNAWWTRPCVTTAPPPSAPTNVLFATWSPDMDVGAKVYSCFVGLSNSIYRAAFQLRLRPSPGALPNALPLPTPVIDFARVTVLNPPWSGGGSGGVDTNAVIDIIHATVDGAARPLPKYLHERSFDDSYPDAAAEYYRSRGDGKTDGGCSAVRDGNLFSRNFDYPLDERAEFVVRMSAGRDALQRVRFASVGVAQVGTNLTEQMVTSGKPSRWYKALPGATVDGINECGVVCEINVVDTEPPRLLGGDIHPLAAVRWALDNGTSAEMVATNLAARVMWPSGWTQNFHWMVADERETWIVENGACSNVTAVAAKRVMTNFKILTDDYTGMGDERYEILRSGGSITNAWFTRAYSRSTSWESEFKDAEEMESAKSAWETYGREELRGKGLWQSVHTSIYDITNRVLRVAVQETDDWYVFAVPTVGGVKPEAVKAIVDAEVGGTNAVKAAVADVAAIKATVETKRDMTNNVCVSTSYGEWTFSGDVIREENYTVNETYQSYFEAWYYTLYINGDQRSYNIYRERALTIEFNFDGRHVTATRSRLCVTGEVFITESAVNNKAEKSDVEEALTAANDANVWSMATYNFMTGGRTNCWFSGTNYVFGADAATRTHFAWEDGMDAATVPCSMALWEIRDGARQLVWDQRDWTAWYWSFKAAQMAADIQGRIDALGNAVTNDANYAWAKRYASDGTPNPDASTTFIDTPSVTLSPGMKWETIANVSGAAYWTIIGNGAVIGGSGTNAVLRIMDFEGNDIMTVTKGEHRLAWLENGDITDNMYDGDGWVCFDMLADVEPVGYFSTTLDQSDFIPQTDPSCPAQYRWENIGGGKWRVHFLLKPGIQSNACFAKFQVEVEGQTVIRYNAGQEISGGLIYNGVKIVPDVSGSPAVGTVIQWKVVR